MAVPFLELALQHEPLIPQLQRGFEQLVRSSQFILGPAVDTFERQLAEYCGARQAVGLSSGTDALLVVLMALDIGVGDEVITTPFTFFATAGAIARSGAKPVFVDIDPESFNIDPAHLEAAVTGSTRLIIPVHLFGRAADMQAINRIARQRDLSVVEDAAQAIGATDGKHRVGGAGQIACFSFYPTKNLAGAGDGGACTLDDDDLAGSLRILRDHGQGPKYHYQRLGGNFRMDALQAMVLSTKLPHLDGWVSRRRHHAGVYRQQLVGLPIQIPADPEDAGHAYNQFTVRIPDGQRDAMSRHLSGRGVGHEIYYPVPLHLQPCFADLGYRRGDLPHSEKASDEVLSLPIYPELTDAQLEKVSQAIREFFL